MGSFPAHGVSKKQIASHSFTCKDLLLRGASVTEKYGAQPQTAILEPYVSRAVSLSSDSFHHTLYPDSI